MRVSRFESIKKPLVVAEEDLRKLASVLCENVGPARFQARCIDGLARTFSNVDELIQYDNVPSKMIQEIEISSHSESRENSVRLSLEDKSYTTASIYLDCEQDIGITANEAVEARLEAMRPWYAWLTSIDFFWVFFALFVFAIVASSTWLILSTNSTSSESASNSARSEGLTTFVILAILVVIFGGGWLFNRMRAKIFPQVSFLIGHGKSRYRNLDKARWTIVIGFVVSIMAAVIVSLIM